MASSVQESTGHLLGRQAISDMLNDQQGAEQPGGRGSRGQEPWRWSEERQGSQEGGEHDGTLSSE